MLYEIKPFFIKTKTNLLVGEGSTTYDIVDNAVQRDSISHLPIINASSLKGALKHQAFFSHHIKTKAVAICRVFGKSRL